MKRLFLLSIGLCIFAIFAHAQSNETRLAKSLIDQRMYAEAARILRPLADGGDAEAQYLAANLFFTGNGVVKSEAQGMKYLTMAVKRYHIDATYEYIMKFQKNTNKDTILGIIEDCLKNNPDASKSVIACMLFLYHDDKEKGWKLIANGATDKKGLFMMDKKKVTSVLKEIHKEFYKYLIDKYINSPKTLKEKLEVEYLYSASRDLGYQWMIESMEYLYEKIKACDYQVQEQHYYTWDRGPFKFLETICACMAYDGIGRTSNLPAARQYAMDVKNSGNIEFPWVKKKIDMILSTYVSGLDVGEGITVNRVKGDSVWVNERNKVKVYLADNLTDHIIALRQEAIELDNQRRNVKVISTRQGIIVESKPLIKHEYDGMTLTFIVKTNTPNNVRFEITSAGCTNDSYYDKVTYKTIGCEGKNGINYIPPHKQVYVKVKIKGIFPTGKFKQLAVGYSSDYGSGYFLVNNLVW